MRGETFVTKKIVSALCKISLSGNGNLYLGNLYSKRDWGHAKDYVVAMWKMLQKKTLRIMSLHQENNISVKYFVNLICDILKIKFIGKVKELMKRHIGMVKLLYL